MRIRRIGMALAAIAEGTSRRPCGSDRRGRAQIIRDCCCEFNPKARHTQVGRPQGHGQDAAEADRRAAVRRWPGPSRRVKTLSRRRRALADRSRSRLPLRIRAFREPTDAGPLRAIPQALGRPRHAHGKTLMSDRSTEKNFPAIRDGDPRRAPVSTQENRNLVPGQARIGQITRR